MLWCGVEAAEGHGTRAASSSAAAGAAAAAAAVWQEVALAREQDL